MTIEGSICPFEGEGVETFSMIALGTLAIGLFSVFVGKFFKKPEETNEIQFPSLT